MSRFRALARLLAGTAMLAAAMPLPAAEHITLKNGFELTCDHREASGSRVRLFTGRDGSNFIEVERDQIESEEFIPDPPAPLPAAGVSASLPASPPAKLSPADLHEILARAGSAHNLDVDLLASLIHAESGGNPRAVSRAGARGLMQLMPGTAAQLGVADSFRPDQNVTGGTAYLDALLLHYHDNLALALAAYNAGPAAVQRYGGVPPYPETRAYVARVIREFNRRKIAEGGPMRTQDGQPGKFLKRAGAQENTASLASASH